MPATIRPARRDDRDAVYDICVRTGDAGGDATDAVDDPDLFGHLYAGAYLEHAPATSFVVEDDGVVLGYVVGATDSVAFAATLEQSWWPPLQARYPENERRDLDSLLVALIHSPPDPDPAVCATHPSHLHIDLLPPAQGRGLGRRLMETIAHAFASQGSPGLHLGVSTRNERAIAFYRHLGLVDLHADPITRTMGWSLPRP